MYLIRFLLNFVVFRVFLWISRLCSCSKYQKPCTYELRHLHFTNWRLKICIWRLYFSGWSPQGDLKIFLISNPEILFLSFTCEDIGVAMVTNMTSQLQESFPLRRVASSFDISLTKAELPNFHINTFSELEEHSGIFAPHPPPPPKKLCFM